MNKKYVKWILFLIILLIILGVSIILSLTVGELKIPVSKLFSILNSQENTLEYTILTKLRIPRAILGLSVGGALSLSGLILQGVYRNPLVEPYTLGISGGATIGITVVIIKNFSTRLNGLMLPIAGFTGALGTILMVYFLSIRKGKININSMLLIGVMVSFVSSSVMMLLMSLTTSDNLHGIIFWIMGSLEEPDSFLINIMFYTSVAALLLTYLFVQPLNALRLGEEKARNLGINTDLSIRILFVISSLLTGIAVSVAGVIGFVGLIIPHIIRYIIGPDYRILIFSSYIGGAAFMLLCDIIARNIIAPNELPIGVITGIAGGTIFIAALKKTHYN